MRGHVQWPPFFSVFWDKYGLFFGRICNPIFDFFFAVKTIYSSDNYYYLQTSEKEIVRGAPLTSHWSYKRKIKIFPPIIQQGILQDVRGGLAVPQWGRPSGGFASARSQTTTLGFKECFSSSVSSGINPPTPCL